MFSRAIFTLVVVIVVSGFAFMVGHLEVAERSGVAVLQLEDSSTDYAIGRLAADGVLPVTNLVVGVVGGVFVIYIWWGVLADAVRLFLEEKRNER